MRNGRHSAPPAWSVPVREPSRPALLARGHMDDMHRLSGRGGLSWWRWPGADRHVSHTTRDPWQQWVIARLPLK
jgi:hypothetical protein